MVKEGRPEEEISTSTLTNSALRPTKVPAFNFASIYQTKMFTVVQLPDDNSHSFLVNTPSPSVPFLLAPQTLLN
jgi:hypothetical protein